jgi:hypothetical protein
MLRDVAARKQKVAAKVTEPEVQQPFSNDPNFIEKEKVYMEYLRKKALENDLLQSPGVDSIPFFQLHGMLCELLSSSQTTLHHSKEPPASRDDETLDAVGKSASLPNYDDKFEEFCAVTKGPHDEKRNYQVNNIDKLRLLPLGLRDPYQVEANRYDLANKEQAHVREWFIIRYDHSVYHKGLNKLYTHRLKSPIPNLPFTFGTRDEDIDRRYNIPHVMSYMRGLVDFKNIRVYVNFNEYTVQNQFKENMFRIACPERECLYLWFPIQDWNTGSLPLLIYWVHLCKYCRDNNMRMIYHCGDGGGRTPFMTLCNLAYMTKWEIGHLTWFAPWDFTPTGEGQLSLTKGDIVTVIERPDNDWVKVKHTAARGAGEGFVPATAIKMSASSDRCMKSESTDISSMINQALEVIKGFTTDKVKRTEVQREFKAIYENTDLYKLMEIFFDDNHNVINFRGELLEVGTRGTPSGREILINRLELIGRVLLVPCDPSFSPYTMEFEWAVDLASRLVE